MFSFLISLVALILGYFLYGRLVERIFGIDSTRKTPAVTRADGVDYVPMPAWKVYMVQFLNIAGTGPIFPCLFITIACGAVSGFHATQSPLMARCLTDEKLGRPVFYGAMITEGIVALIWATVSSWFFFDGGAEAVGSTLHAAAPEVVVNVSKSWLGVLGGVLAVLGVVAAPITSGDTAFRSARLIVADFLHLDQKPPRPPTAMRATTRSPHALRPWLSPAHRAAYSAAAQSPSHSLSKTIFSSSPQNSF